MAPEGETFPAPPRPLRFADFADRIGESFPATSRSGRAVALHLVAAARRDVAVHGASGFSLEFRVEPDDGSHQQMFELEHPEAGTHPIFLVAVGHDERGTLHQSVFSFLPEPVPDT